MIALVNGTVNIEHNKTLFNDYNIGNHSLPFSFNTTVFEHQKNLSSTIEGEFLSHAPWHMVFMKDFSDQKDLCHSCLLEIKPIKP
jgi:hypothetical protein